MTELIAAVKSAKLAYGFFSYINTKLDEYQESKAREFFNTIISNFRDGALTAEEFQTEIEDRLNSSITDRDRTLKLLSLSYRALLDSVDDRVLPALARLTAQYLDKLSSGNLPHLKVSVDSFYRGLCRLLSDLSGDEFEEMKTLFTHVQEAPEYTGLLYFDYIPGEPRPQTQGNQNVNPLVGVWIHFCKANSTDKTTINIGQLHHIERLSNLLIRNGFEASAWMNRIAQSAYGTILVRLDFPTMLRISKIILP